MSEEGIDVSHCNGEIDWSKVAKDGVIPILIINEPNKKHCRVV